MFSISCNPIAKTAVLLIAFAGCAIEPSADESTDADTCQEDQPAPNCPCSFSQLVDPTYPQCCIANSLAGWLCDGKVWTWFNQSCESWNETCPYCPPCPDGWTL